MISRKFDTPLSMLSKGAMTYIRENFIPEDSAYELANNSTVNSFADTYEIRLALNGRPIAFDLNLYEYQQASDVSPEVFERVRNLIQLAMFKIWAETL